MTVIMVALCFWWLNSEQGIALRATGDNPAHDPRARREHRTA